MMFMMPIPPTTSDTAAIEPRRIEMVSTDSCCAARAAAAEVAVKSSSCAAAILWRTFNNEVICSIAPGIASSDLALAMM